MKSALKSFQIFLLLCGVFGADKDEVKSVSVMEGDSVTLNPDPDKIKKFNLLEWRFGDPVIAQTDRKEISYYNHTEIFRDRLQLDQTGSLTIRNMRTKHSGLYKLKISHSTGTSNMKFNVSVHESSSVIAGAEAEMKSMSVKVGDPVTLHVPQIQGDELIVWRFGDEGKLIAKHDLEAKSSPLYYEEERFRDRLKLDQTGSLTITNTRTTDSGLYTVKISSNKQTLSQQYVVTISERGLSGGAVAGIVVGVLLLAAAAAGVIYFFRRPRTTNLPSQTWSVLRGDYVTLNPETEIQTGDEIQWLFGHEETLIAEIKGENREKTHEGPDEIFKNRLKLDETTGSLTINEILTKHAGLYTLKIRRGRETLYQRFIVSVEERRLVIEGDPVTLHPETKIQNGDEVQWLFGDEEQTVLTEIKNTKVTKYAGTDWRFRDRLKLDEETGSLTIRNTTAAHTGYYTLKITRGRDKIYKRFFIFVEEMEITVTEGESVTLEPAREIQNGDEVQWLFGDEEQTVLTEIKNTKVTEYDGTDERFRDRLKLNEETGDLTIKNFSAAHEGYYTLKITRGREKIYKRFYVSVEEMEITVMEGKSVNLEPARKIKNDDLIQWLFGDEEQQTLIAELNGKTGEILPYDDVADERFRDRLDVDKTTGSLTIKNMRTAHSGVYKIEIRSSSEVSEQTFIVTVSVTDKVEEKFLEEDSVTLNPDTKIQRDDQILWMFGYQDDLIAQIKGGTVDKYDGVNKRFRGRLKLDKMTGSLTITKIEAEHTGLYKLQIISSSGGILVKRFKVSIKPRTESSMKEKTDSRRNRVNESVTVEMENDPLLNGEDVDVENEEEGMSSL